MKSTTRVRVRERLAHLLVHDEVEIAPAVPRLAVGEPVKLLRQGTKRLREQAKPLDAQRQLTRAGAERDALRADEVAEVPPPELRVAPRPGDRRGARRAEAGPIRPEGARSSPAPMMRRVIIRPAIA